MEEYSVTLIASAKNDLKQIVNYYENNVSIKLAETVYQNLSRVVLSLSTFPKRGHLSPELEDIAIFKYREVHYKTYRILYEVRGSEVVVIAIFDGRRDCRTFLMDRILL